MHVSHGSLERSAAVCTASAAAAQLPRVCWVAECVTLKDNTFPQLRLLIEFAHDASDRIYKAIVASTDGTAALKPILRPYDTVGSTR
jgi:hypothetical protein